MAVKEKNTTPTNSPGKSGTGRFNQSLDDFLSLARTDCGVTLYSQQAVAEVLVYSAHVIRIKIYKKNQQVGNFSYAVVSSPAVSDFDLIEEPHRLILRTPAMELRIAKHPLRFAFYTPDGILINEDEPAFGTSWIGHEVTTYKTLHEKERFIGLGEKTGNLDRRGNAYTNWNTDKFAYPVDGDPIYLTTPFYIGIKDHVIPYGIFFDNSHKTVFNFGASNDRFSYFSAEDGVMDYYFIHHTHVHEIVESYTGLTGRMPLPPKWSLGFQQCRYSYYPDSQVLNVARTFREKEIPADVIYLDIHYMDGYRLFTWHPERFPNPKKLSDELQKIGFHLVVILDPGIKREKNYPAYEEGIEQDLFVKYPDGVPFSGQVWPGWSCFPDFTNPDVREWWSNKMKVFTETGIEGFWNDMNEPAAWGQHLPDLIEFDYEGEGATHKRARNVYGMQMARSTYQGAKKNLPNKRPFVLTRAGYSGVQRYAAVWTGDNVSSNEHMMAGIRLINSMGLAGIGNAGNDVGGFAGEADAGLMARWMTIGAFSPFFRAHSMINGRDSEPWTFGEEAEDIARNYIKLRYRLMPYLYSMFYACASSGIPVARSLALYYHHDETIYSNEFQHQYLFGDSMLVVPLESDKEFVKYYLPEGLWYDFYTDELHCGSNKAIREVSKEILPVYVKAGAIIPMQTDVLNLKQKPSKCLMLHVYAGGDGSFRYYEDDGESFDYEQGHFYEREIRLALNQKTLILDKVKGDYISHFTTIRIYFHGFSGLSAIRMDAIQCRIQREQLRFINPISDFDPYNKPPKDPIQIHEISFIEIPNRYDKLLIEWLDD